MPIDSRDKRGSIIGFGLPFRHVLPNPDPQVEDQGDRQQLEFLYRGIIALNINLFFKGPIGADVFNDFERRHATIGVSAISTNDATGEIGATVGSSAISAKTATGKIGIEL